jgi:hypothetical protein
MLELIPCQKYDKEYKEIRDRHYIPNRGTVGRQCHYKIYKDLKLIGIISGASCVWNCKPRDDFFEINKQNRVEKINYLISNTVFRLEETEPNLGTRILSMWRKQIVRDWYIKYNIIPKGFETFICGEGRYGSLYKADNWTYVGLTKGKTQIRPKGFYNFHGERQKLNTDIKMIFCKNITRGDITLLNQYKNTLIAI